MNTFRHLRSDKQKHSDLKRKRWVFNERRVPRSVLRAQRTNYSFTEQEQNTKKMWSKEACGDHERNFMFEFRRNSEGYLGTYCWSMGNCRRLFGVYRVKPDGLSRPGWIDSVDTPETSLSFSRGPVDPSQDDEVKVTLWYCRSIHNRYRVSRKAKRTQSSHNQDQDPICHQNRDRNCAKNHNTHPHRPLSPEKPRFERSVI